MYIYLYILIFIYIYIYIHINIIYMYVYITYLTYYIVNQGCWFCLFNPLLQVLETVVLGPTS